MNESLVTVEDTINIKLTNYNFIKNDQLTEKKIVFETEDLNLWYGDTACFKRN